MNSHRTFVTAFLLCCCLMHSGTADVTALQSLYAWWVTNYPTIYSASVTTLDASSISFQATVTMGKSNVTTNAPMTDSTSFRMNSASDILVAAAVEKLIALGVVPTSFLTDSINLYLPNSPTTFQNPASNFALTTITLKSVLQHTSSIGEGLFDAFRKRSGSGASVISFSSFCTQYFLMQPSGSATYMANTSIFDTTLSPNQYSYSRANTALAACVVENIVSTYTAVSLASTDRTFASFVQEYILTPLGMTGTFVLDVTGQPPKSPSGSPLYTGAMVQDLSSTGSAQSTVYIHPAYMADYMYFTTSSDMAKLIRSLFLPQSGTASLLSSIGSVMLSTSVSLGATGGSVRGQALGVRMFIGSLFCNAAGAYGVPACPVPQTSIIYGSWASGVQTVFAWFCTTAASTASPTCTIVQLNYYEGASVFASDLVLSFTVSAWYQKLGKSTQVNTNAPTSDNTVPGFYSPTSPNYGVFVSLGVVGTFVFVIVASYAAEHLIHPAPIVAAVPPQSLPIPQQGQFYGNAGGGMGGYNHNIAPPMRGDFYDQ